MEEEKCLLATGVPVLLKTANQIMNGELSSKILLEVGTKILLENYQLTV